jgi:hypothetical protein
MASGRRSPCSSRMRWRPPTSMRPRHRTFGRITLARVDRPSPLPLMSAVRHRNSEGRSTVRPGPRWTLVIGAMLAAIAASGSARAEVHTINLDRCSGNCFAPATDDSSAAKGAAAKTTLSRSGGKPGQPNDPAPTLMLDRKAMPPPLVSGLPSPLASASVPVPSGDSPYDYFEDVIDIPLATEARTEFAEASLFFFAPSLLGRLTEVLSAGAAVSGKYSPPPPM